MEASSSCQPDLKAPSTMPMSADHGVKGQLSKDQPGPVEQPLSSKLRNNGHSLPAESARSQTPSVLGYTSDTACRSSSLLREFDSAIFSTDYPDFVHGELLTSSTRKHVEVNFRELQELRFKKLRRELVNRVMYMHFSDGETNDWEDLLKEYITAVRDNEFIAHSINDNSDFFESNLIVTSTIENDAILLGRELSRLPLELRESKGPGDWTSINFALPTYSEDGQDIFRLNEIRERSRQRKENFRQTLQRMGMAILGGVFLVGPMWLMVLRNQLYTTLITTTAFVFGFGLALSLIPTFVGGSKIGLDTMMSATAAYAAVLVVFVGTTLQATTSGS